MTSEISSPQGEVLRMPGVERKLGLKRSAIYAKLIPAGRYFDPMVPTPVALGKRTVGWVSSELDEWVEHKRAERDGGVQ